MSHKAKGSDNEFLRVKVIIADLKKIQEDCAVDKETGERVAKFDETRDRIQKCLDDVRKDITTLAEIREKKGRDHRDVVTISLRSTVQRNMSDAVIALKDLKKIVQEEAKTKTKTDPAEHKYHEEIVANLDHALQLVQAVINPNGGGVRDRERDRERDRPRRQRRRRSDADADADTLSISLGTLAGSARTTEEKEFCVATEASLAEQDLLLGQIEAGLDTLQTMAQDMGKNLTLHRQILETTEAKIDKQIGELDTVNRRLKKILDDGGGAVWGTVLVLTILVVAVTVFMLGIL